MRHSDNTVLFNNYSYTARYLAAAQCIEIGPVCGFVIVGRRAVSEPYYSQCARSVCVSLSVFFHYVNESLYSNFLQQGLVDK